jgi:Ala-tRNA(Pro) deacylase
MQGGVFSPPPPQKIRKDKAMTMKQFLQQHRVPFEVVPHAEAYGAQRVAQALHTPGSEVAKTVLLRADQDYSYVVAVLPATHKIDFERLSEFLGGTPLELATETEIAEHCPDCEFGVLPPFGSHYGAQSIVDESLTHDELISFECDSHSEAVRMKYSDFYDVEHPLVAAFASHA